MLFPDATFDVVVAQFVITAVPDPEAALDEFARVVRPGGEIVLVNHIGAEAASRRLFECVCAAGAPARLAAGIPPGRLDATGRRAHGGVRVIERRPMPPIGHFSLIRFAKLAAGKKAA